MNGAAVLQRLTRLATARDIELADLRRFHAELLRYAIIRRYRSPWIRRAFRERFGLSPPAEWARDDQAKWIRPETYAWIRAGAAAYARRMESGGRK